MPLLNTYSEPGTVLVARVLHNPRKSPFRNSVIPAMAPAVTFILLESVADNF